MTISAEGSVSIGATGSQITHHNIRDLIAGIIHRHTGGLEKKGVKRFETVKIHRHTGGLEKSKRIPNKIPVIHRHTGGLESWFVDFVPY